MKVRPFVADIPAPMALTSASTIDTAKAQRDDNVGWEVEGSVSKAKLRLEALLFIQDRSVSSVTTGTGSVSDNPEKLSSEIAYIRRWLAANDATFANAAGAGVVRHADMSVFRS